MNVVVLTYPGHFLMTLLCLNSLEKFYSPDRYYVLYDDFATSAWPDYVKDCFKYYQFKNLELIPYSSAHPAIKQCKVGWWRQQLTKLCIDQCLPGDQWFVVDGDVIFDEHVDIRGVIPVHGREEHDSPISIMVTRYVEFMLNAPRVSIRNQTAITSSIPFRWLDRLGLTDLRSTVSSNIGTECIAAHVAMFESGDIVGFDPNATKMVMHEWELIEAYNQLTRPGQYRVIETGSGYHTQSNTDSMLPGHRFRHSSMMDAELTPQWIDQQGFLVPDDIWAKCLAYKAHRDLYHG
jgi:hypothetical protein